jgi:hypothetical protein
LLISNPIIYLIKRETNAAITATLTKTNIDNFSWLKMHVKSWRVNKRPGALNGGLSVSGWPSMALCTGPEYEMLPYGGSPHQTANC